MLIARVWAVGVVVRSTVGVPALTESVQSPAFSGMVSSVMSRVTVAVVAGE